MIRLSKKLLLFFALISAIILRCGGAAAAVEDEDPLLGVKEGWAWPVVVIKPENGWESPEGDAIKHAMRTAEREISTQREAIRGREITFMFSDIADRGELPSRLETWRAMNVSAIVSFADSGFNEILAELCRERGPSLLFAGGDDMILNSPNTGRPWPYLFALDLPYYARANALAEAAYLARHEQAAVVTDILSRKLAAGAEQNIRFLRARGLDTLNLSVAAYRQDEFLPQVREAASGGTKLFICWLDAMATLSIWQNSQRRQDGIVVYYSGGPQQILTDADGLVIVDRDVLLDRNEDGRHVIINKIRDAFNVIVEDPVTAAKAYAMAKWVVGAYQVTGVGETPNIALALGRIGEIPLMDEILSIDPATHRPKSRKYGVLRVQNRTYESHGSVEVFSRETIE
jgi:hypothetical protein